LRQAALGLAIVTMHLEIILPMLAVNKIEVMAKSNLI
jgi:hypothetical protein